MAAKTDFGRHFLAFLSFCGKNRRSIKPVKTSRSRQHVRDLDGWETLDGVTFTPFETARENATHRKYLGDTPEKRTKGLITGRGTFWLVDADSNKATYLSLR